MAPTPSMFKRQPLSTSLFRHKRLSVLLVVCVTSLSYHIHWSEAQSDPFGQGVADHAHYNFRQYVVKALYITILSEVKLSYV